MRRYELDPSERDAFGFICDYFAQHLRMPSLAEVSSGSILGRTTVADVMARLVKKGYLVRAKSEGQRSPYEIPGLAEAIKPAVVEHLKALAASVPTDPTTEEQSDEAA